MIERRTSSRRATDSDNHRREAESLVLGAVCGAPIWLVVYLAISWVVEWFKEIGL